MKRRRAATFALVSVVIVGIGAGAAVATNTADRPTEEQAALDGLAARSSTDKERDLIAWIEDLTSPRSSDGAQLEVAASPPDAAKPSAADRAQIDLLIQQEAVLLELAELWSPLEKDYQAADERERERMIVDFVDTNQQQLQSIKERSQQLEAELDQTQTEAGE